MENTEGEGEEKWSFNPNHNIISAAQHTVRSVYQTITANLDGRDQRPTISLAIGDPSAFPCFHTTPVAVDAIISAVRSANYNSYPPPVGILPARRAIAEHLSRDLPYKLSSDDIYITAGCTLAIETVLTVLSRPGANILLPRPGYPYYKSYAAFCGVEVRDYSLNPERSWEIDLDSLMSLADKNTVAMVVINPGNPCGNVFTYEHLAEVAKTAKKLGILVIADEVYRHLTFGTNPFVPMGTFGSLVPILTLGSISKRWVVPGWRLGWIAVTDPRGILKKNKVLDCFESYFTICADPVTFIQGAIPQILGDTGEDFFNETTRKLKQTADICCERIKEINCITCPYKPEGAMSAMVKLDLSLLEDILDDVDFCCKLAKEESVIILPGSAVGLKNWLRVTFATGPSALEDGLERVKSFCQRHAKKH
ncbi:nicotianamine aminotransferase A-like protein [Cinnamomum micranthum f. kanehirae]|uniref:Nicotianamine aminotransferase A-like protein n=1 Tax=Cinnamomum micranthum f. kanehirae TaxID=337451 RepID=A0A443PFQ3_9MAGN|nr:nicotianamine aminotransferase A-like protein [Cinnamomum micranthum f. kanehirae]